MTKTAVKPKAPVKEKMDSPASIAAERATIYANRHTPAMADKKAREKKWQEAYDSVYDKFLKEATPKARPIEKVGK